MTTPQLGTLCGKGEIAVRRHFAEFQHWGLIDLTDKGNWCVTYKGRQFVEGLISVPKWTWPRGRSSRPSARTDRLS
jgi:hypothetical protein